MTSLSILDDTVKRKLSNKAHRLLLKQASKLKPPNSGFPDVAAYYYTNSFTNIYSLPCHHCIQRELDRDPTWQVSIRDVDSHWYLRVQSERLVATKLVYIAGDLPTLPPQQPVARPILGNYSYVRDPQQVKT